MKHLLDFLNPNRGEDNNRQKLKTMALSLFFAITIWLVVVYIFDPSINLTLKDVDIRFSGESSLKENGLVLTGKDKLPSMSVSVSGKRSDLIDYMNNVYINIDVENVTQAGEYEFKTSVEMPTSKLSLERGGSTKVKLTAEPLITKNIQIITKQTGSNKSFLIKSEIEENYVEISGAQSEIEKIAYGVAIIDISSIHGITENNFPYLLYDENNNQITANTTIEAKSAVVKVRNIPYMKAALPVIPTLSSDLAHDYVIDLSKTAVSPTTVEVGITADFHGTGIAANVDKLTSEETEFYLTGAEGLYIPEDNSTVKIKPVITRKQTKTMKLPLKAVNIPEDTTADFVQEIEVIVECAEYATEDNVTAHIDLSELDKGTHKIPVIISGAGVASWNYIEVDVTIK